MEIQHGTSQQNDGGESNTGQAFQPLAPKQFIEIIEHMNDGVVVLDKNWYYVYVNQKAAMMLQRQTPSDLIGKHIWTEYPDGVGQPFQMAYERAMRDQTPVVFEDHYEPWDLWFENRIYPSPESLLILFTEITDRKRIEKLLDERQYFLQKILDTEPGTVYIYDLEERRNVYINHYWLQIFGYSEEETQVLGGQLLDQIIHPEDLAYIAMHHENWRQTVENDIREIEFRVCTKAGEWRWLHSREVPFTRNETGQVKQILGIAHDVTERKQIEKALRESEKRYQLISTVASDYMFSSRLDADGKLTLNWVAGAFEAITGYTMEEYVAQGGWRSTLHPDDLAVDDRDLEKLRLNQPVISEVRTFTKNGELTWVRVYAQPVLDAERKALIGIYGAVQDITERKHSDTALREREKQLSSIYEAVGDVIFQLSVEADGLYRFTSANEAFFKTTGLNRDMLLGKRVDEIIPEPSLSLVLQKYKEAIKTRKIIRWEEVSRYPTGELTGEVSIAPVFDDHGHCTHLVGAVHDITERKKAEEELHEQNRFISVLAETTPGLVYIYDWQTDSNVYSNRGMEFLLGYTSEEVKNMGNKFFALLLHPDDGDAVVASQQRLVSASDQDMLEVDYRLRHANGEWRWLRSYERPFARNPDGSLKQKIGIAIDITEHKRTEDALAASEAELRALFAAMDDVVLVIDRDGVYRKIAPTNPNLLYKPAEELLGKTLRDVFPTEQAESFIETVRQVVETQQTAHVEYSLVIDDRVVWFDASISRMDPNSTLWMVRDITDRKRAEEGLRQLNEELEQRIAARTEELAAAMIRAQEADRLKSAFLAAMSHELRTPLNSIIGFTGVILQGLAGPLNEEQTKQLNMTRDSARHLLALINDVLDISKIEAGELEILKRPFDMRQAIESALRFVHPLAQKKRLQLTTLIGSGVGTLNNDRRRVEQVLINLINNAVKFTEHGEITIKCQIKDGWLETIVQDEGIGIKPEDMGKLFKPFQQIDTGPARSHEGTGLGLAICKRLVTAMGGEISVESQWRVGSTFKFTLPL